MYRNIELAKHLFSSSVVTTQRFFSKAFPKIILRKGHNPCKQTCYIHAFYAATKNEEILGKLFASVCVCACVCVCVCVCACTSTLRETINTVARYSGWAGGRRTLSRTHAHTHTRTHTHTHTHCCQHFFFFSAHLKSLFSGPLSHFMHSCGRWRCLERTFLSHSGVGSYIYKKGNAGPLNSPTCLKQQEGWSKHSGTQMLVKTTVALHAGHVTTVLFSSAPRRRVFPSNEKMTSVHVAPPPHTHFPSPKTWKNDERIMRRRLLFLQLTGRDTPQCVCVCVCVSIRTRWCIAYFRNVKAGFLRHLFEMCLHLREHTGVFKVSSCLPVELQRAKVTYSNRTH